jgi:hypothetical protein
MALEMEYVSPCGGSVRRIWKQGSYTEDSERYVIEEYGNGAFLL